LLAKTKSDPAVPGDGRIAAYGELEARFAGRRRGTASRRASVSRVLCMTSPLEQKLKITGPVVITANRLRDGAVVYRTQDRNWSTRLDEAAVVTTAPAATEVLAAAAADGISVVGAYVAPVKITADGRPQPGNLRESIRYAGPTVAPATTIGI
jgi:hypothetical protein